MHLGCVVQEVLLSHAKSERSRARSHWGNGSTSTCLLWLDKRRKDREELGVPDTQTACCGAYQEDTGVENDGDRCGTGARARAQSTGTEHGRRARARARGTGHVAWGLEGRWYIFTDIFYSTQSAVSCHGLCYPPQPMIMQAGTSLILWAETSAQRFSLGKRLNSFRTVGNIERQPRKSMFQECRISVR